MEGHQLWARPQDIDVLESLIESIESGNCVVFIGSGLSANAKFPLWDHLVSMLYEETCTYAGEVLERLDDPYTLVDQCRDVLGDDRYFRFLIDKFGPNANRLPTTTAYQNIDQIPFCAFVTTNYDHCLINASRQNRVVRELHAYPRLPAIHLRSVEPHQYYLHGFVDPLHPQETVQFIILSQNDYKRSYEEEEEIGSFLYQLITNCALLFVGFGLKDEFLMKQLGRITSIYQRRSEELMEKSLILPQRNRYAILPFSNIERDLTEISITDYREGPDFEEREDAKYEEYGVHVLRYHPQTESHSGLEKIIAFLRDRTSKKPLPPTAEIRDFAVA